MTRAGLPDPDRRRVAGSKRWQTKRTRAKEFIKGADDKASFAALPPAMLLGTLIVAGLALPATAGWILILVLMPTLAIAGSRQLDPGMV